MELRTPLGCRDILSRDVRKRKELCSRILNVFDRFGFEEVQSPAVEYYQTYNQAFSSLQDRMMIKLFDENMDILALRLDMTVPIARLAATALKNAKIPLRLSYLSDVWKTRKKYFGKSAQTTDCGIELIGSTDDREILVCALEALKASGLQNWKLELSDARLVENPAEMVFDNPEDIARLGDLIDQKSMVELEEFLNSFDLPERIRTYFLSLPLLDGSMDVLARAMDLAFDPQTLMILEQLRETGEFLRTLGYGDSISFDLGKLPHLNYYTGLIFEAYVPGASSSVLSGGRYDNLMGSFGRDLPAIGFAFKIDPLAALLQEPACRQNLVIRYPSSLAFAAFELAAQKRQETSVCLCRDDELEELVLEWEERP